MRIEQRRARLAEELERNELNRVAIMYSLAKWEHRLAEFHSFIGTSDDHDQNGYKERMNSERDWVDPEFREYAD